MKRNFYIAILFTILASTFCSLQAAADVILKNDTVYGIVVGKDGKPLPGAKVEIEGQSVSTFTDLDGRFNVRCEPGAKNIRVSYPKVPNVKTRIKPDMTVKMGRTWRDAPDHYQWFIGANFGYSLTNLMFDNLGNASHTYDIHESTSSLSISLMGGRVKNVGWYVKAFANLPAEAYDYSYDPYTNNHYAEYVDTNTFGGILGGMVRMGCPLHFCLGVGVATTNISNIPTYYRHLNWQLDFGFLFRIKNHFGVNLSVNVGIDKDVNYIAGSYGNLGISYFFNK